MNKIKVIGLIFFLLLNGIRSALDAATPQKPNIIFILADDIGYECIGANGGTSYQTPHLDTLARSGTRFTNCFSTPICTPSRVQLLTGMYSCRNYTQFAHMDPKQITFAQVLKKSEYKTGIVGKWQLGGDLETPHQLGFDEYCLWQAAGKRGSRYANPTFLVNGKLEEKTDGKYGPDIESEFAIDFLRRHKDENFLLYYSTVLPHNPFEPTPESKNGKLGDPAKPEYFEDMVSYLDKSVGKLVKQLDDLGLRENTIIFFVGDNGTHSQIQTKMGDTVVRGGKGKISDNGIHVPLIINWKGTTPEGKVSDDLIDFSDFFPTFLDLAGTSAPGNLHLDGNSIYPQILGKNGRPREWVYCYYEPRFGSVNDVKISFAREHDWKLTSEGQLFDLKNDPLEKNPLEQSKDSSPMKEARQRLKKVIDSYPPLTTPFIPKEGSKNSE